jgi:hypothetical protein
MVVQRISISDINALFDTRATFALIDVREPGAYNASHIPRSSLVPRRQLGRCDALPAWGGGTGPYVCAASSVITRSLANQGHEVLFFNESGR